MATCTHLDQIRDVTPSAEGCAVIPRSPFVASYIRRHPEYAELVPPGTSIGPVVDLFVSATIVVPLPAPGCDGGIS